MYQNAQPKPDVWRKENGAFLATGAIGPKKFVGHMNHRGNAAAELEAVQRLVAVAYVQIDHVAHPSLVVRDVGRLLTAIVGG